MAVEIAGHLVCVVVTMRRLVTVMAACLWGCGDNGIAPADAPHGRPPFQPAPHAPLPPVFPHAGIVLSNVQLVTLTFDDYAARPQVETFGDIIVGSPWYKDVGMEYGVSAGTHVAKLTLGPAPAQITRADIEDRIKQVIASGLVPRPARAGNQLLYLIYIPPAVTRGADLDGIQGYHQMITLDGVRVPIAVVLDDGSGLDTTTSTAAHQLINAVTNPYDPPMDGYYADPPMNDPWSFAAGEIADLCHGENPVVEDGFTLPRVYSSAAAGAGRFPCKPVMADDAWTDVSAEPSSIQVVRKGGSVTFTLTGWSTQELPDWELRTHVADFSKLTEAAMRPELSDDRINNSTSVQLTLHVPDTAISGSIGGVYVLSGANVRPWLVGFIVQ
jgi:hypothetical protein